MEARWPPSIFRARGDELQVYVVLEEVTRPAGLYGAHGRDFIIPVGGPGPKGPEARCSFHYLKDHTFE